MIVDDFTFVSLFTAQRWVKNHQLKNFLFKKGITSRDLVMIIECRYLELLGKPTVIALSVLRRSGRTGKLNVKSNRTDLYFLQRSGLIFLDRKGVKNVYDHEFGLTDKGIGLLDEYFRLLLQLESRLSRDIKRSREMAEEKERKKRERLEKLKQLEKNREI